MACILLYVNLLYDGPFLKNLIVYLSISFM
jgi:hypothetical protein